VDFHLLLGICGSKFRSPCTVRTAQVFESRRARSVELNPPYIRRGPHTHTAPHLTRRCTICTPQLMGVWPARYSTWATTCYWCCLPDETTIGHRLTFNPLSITAPICMRYGEVGNVLLYNCIFTAQCTLVHMRGLGIACRLSVCPSVRLSVTFVDCDHIGWKSWKLIARTISPTPSLFVAKKRST